MIKNHIPNPFTPMLIQASSRALKELSDLNMYSVNIDGGIYRLQPVMNKIFRNMPEMLYAANSSEIKGSLDMTFEPSVHDGCNCFTMYHGTPIWLVQTEKRNRSGGEYTKTYLKTFNTPRCVHNLKIFIKKISVKGMKESRKGWDKYTTLHTKGSQYASSTHKLRTFDDVYIESNQKKQLIESVDNFVKNRKWYIEHNIPYHFGILLYGPAGTGKSSIAQAIATHLKAQTHFIYGDEILDFASMIGTDIPADTMSEDAYRVIIVEDIDCGLEAKPRMMPMMLNDDDATPQREKKPKNGFASLLNSLDGITAPTNTLYIFTTNHIEKLDSALIRPGRIDLKIEIKGISLEALNEFLMSHFGRTCDEEIKINPEMTFAKLQTLVMMGSSFEDILEVVKDEDTESDPNDPGTTGEL